MPWMLYRSMSYDVGHVTDFNIELYIEYKLLADNTIGHTYLEVLT